MRKIYQYGFTLIEVLVILAIIGILAGIVVISVNDARNKGKIAAGLQFDASIKHLLGVDIVGEWSFNEGSGSDIADSSGYNNNATNYGATWVDSIPRLGKALNFVGGQSVRTNSTSSSLNLAGKDVTITAWVKFNSIQSGWRSIYSYYPSTAGWYTLYKSNANTLHMRIGGVILNGNETFIAGRWYFLVGTWDNTIGIKRMTLYINGKEDKRANLSPTWTSSADSYGYVGGSSGGENIDAIIDEVKVYSSTLGAAKIKELYLAGLEQRKIFVKN